jgi:hypothetical protein
MQRKLSVAALVSVSVVLFGCTDLPIRQVVGYDYSAPSATAPYAFGPEPYAMAPYWYGDDSTVAGWGGYGDGNYLHGMHPWGNWRLRLRRDRVSGGLHGEGIGFHGDGLLSSSLHRGGH